MYTGLAQPEVNMKGLSVKNSTAFTSSSILAVVSAMKALSAKCMGARILLEWGQPIVGGSTMGAITRKAAVLAALAALPLVAQAQNTYRCTGKDGKRYYGSTIPQPCYGVRVEMLNAQGMVVRRIDPEADEKERAAKEAEAEKQRKRESASREASRRDRA